jgi:quercetin dioxygenase-like cupin family protein
VDGWAAFPFSNPDKIMSSSTLLPLDRAAVVPLLAAPAAVTPGIVSQSVLVARGLRVTLFRFSAGQEMSEHTSTARALVQVLAGRGDFDFNGQTQRLGPGDLLHLPPKLPHAVRAVEDMTMLLTQCEIGREP